MLAVQPAEGGNPAGSELQVLTRLRRLSETNEALGDRKRPLMWDARRPRKSLETHSVRSGV